jgi:predicted amidophosphoribosyltransferase
MPPDPFSNLPPGVTQRDIELYSGNIRICERCGRDFDIEDNDQELCPKCREEEDKND